MNKKKKLKKYFLLYPVLLLFVFITSCNGQKQTDNTNKSIPNQYEIDSYLYEAKCQLLMYASIASIKLNTIVLVLNFVFFFVYFVVQL